MSRVVATVSFSTTLQIASVVCTAMAKRFSLPSSTSHISLMENERDIQDTVYFVNHPPFYHQVTLNAENSLVFSAMKKSSALSACIPKAHFFLEFIYWLVSSMYPGKCFIMNSQGKNVLQVSTQLIRQAFCFSEDESSLQFLEDSLHRNTYTQSDCCIQVGIS